MDRTCLDRDCDTDPHKDVLVSSFDLINYAKDIAADDDELFSTLLEMVRDYQQERFNQLKGAA